MAYHVENDKINNFYAKVQSEKGAPYKPHQR